MRDIADYIKQSKREGKSKLKKRSKIEYTIIVYKNTSECYTSGNPTCER